jgi:SAM domain (Sterile alpha motif)
VQEIGDWLEKLGMPEYGECFAENKVDLSVLPHLTDQDLKDIGVPLGHRRKMLAAVAQLDDASIAEARVPAPGSLKPQPPVASTSPPTPEAAGERRHVTGSATARCSARCVPTSVRPSDRRVSPVGTTGRQGAISPAFPISLGPVLPA